VLPPDLPASLRGGYVDRAMKKSFLLYLCRLRIRDIGLAARLAVSPNITV
jgi:hypothetical protein